MASEKLRCDVCGQWGDDFGSTVWAGKSASHTCTGTWRAVPPEPAPPPPVAADAPTPIPSSPAERVEVVKEWRRKRLISKSTARRLLESLAPVAAKAPRLTRAERLAAGWIEKWGIKDHDPTTPRGERWLKYCHGAAKWLSGNRRFRWATHESATVDLARYKCGDSRVTPFWWRRKPKAAATTLAVGDRVRVEFDGRIDYLGYGDKAPFSNLIVKPDSAHGVPQYVHKEAVRRLP